MCEGPILNFRLANLRVADGYTLGAEVGQRLLNVRSTAQAIGKPYPKDMDDMLQHGLFNMVADVVKAIQDPASMTKGVFFDPETIQYAPLVTRPEKILCIGFNYQQHAVETNTPIPKEPAIFAKFANALNHHNGTTFLPTRLDNRFDYETELVIVFGKKCKNVNEADALDYVAGYSIGNDISARSKQTITTQFTAGKASDGFAPLGPWLVPSSLVPSPNHLRLQTFVNGQKRQDWTTGDMIYDCRQLIAYVSSIMTIKPGDVLFTGTPQGVVFGERAPVAERRWLKAGDSIVSAIESLGELRISLEEDTSPSVSDVKTGEASPPEPKEPGTIDRMVALNGGEACVDDLSQWSPGRNIGRAYRFANNSYVLKHGDALMVWDTGVPDEYFDSPQGRTPVHNVRGVIQKTLRSQLDEMDIHPDKVTHIAFSHAHFDHIGNCRLFPNARWFVQESEYNAMFGPDADSYGFLPELYQSMQDHLTVITGNHYDVFGDGTVTIFATPGHTPGHQSLLVRLKETGPLLLTGDVAHFCENLQDKGVPVMNPLKEETVESMKEVEMLASREKAEIWINHDPDHYKRWPHAPQWIF